MDRRRIVVLVLLIASPVLIACEPQRSCTTSNVMVACPDAGRAPEPGPDTQPKGHGDPHPQADPKGVPTNTGKGPLNVHMECNWEGQRWFEITPEMGGDPLTTFEKKWTSNTGGHWESNYRIGPGTQVGLTCAPLKNTGDDKTGFAQCVIKMIDPPDIVRPQGYVHAPQGKVRCWGTTPL